jgi:hypothetical protein
MTHQHSTVFAATDRTRAVIAVVCAVWIVAASSLKADDSQQFSAWSAPVNLGAAVNSAAGDYWPFISRDGLSLYFTATTCPPPPGTTSCLDDTNAFGGFDIYVSQRSSTNNPWGSPQNLGPAINTAANDMAPSLSPDGHVLFFSSDRPGGFGGSDIYASRRHDKRDNFGWQYPENLGSGVNTAAHEAGPNCFEDESTNTLTLYFDSNRVPSDPTLASKYGPYTDNAAHNGNDIWASVLEADWIFGPARLVTELSTAFADRKPHIRRDGLELFLASDRPGGLGAMDLWVSTWDFSKNAWSIPANLGSIVNTTGNDAGPAVSFDETTLYFQSARPGGLGAYDLYASTRTKVK